MCKTVHAETLATSRGMGWTLRNKYQRWVDRHIERYSTTIHINPCMTFFKTNFNPSNITLHVFADASTRAYGAVAFFTSDSDINFVMAKNRVAPLKRLTLPKLELMAAVIASRIAKFIIDALKLQNRSIHFWGDSQITLYWLESTKTLPQFVSSRVTEIKEIFWVQLVATAPPVIILWIY